MTTCIFPTVPDEMASPDEVSGYIRHVVMATLRWTATAEAFGLCRGTVSRVEHGHCLRPATARRAILSFRESGLTMLPVRWVGPAGDPDEADTDWPQPRFARFELVRPAGDTDREAISDFRVAVERYREDGDPSHLTATFPSGELPVTVLAQGEDRQPSDQPSRWHPVVVAEPDLLRDLATFLAELLEVAS